MLVEKPPVDGFAGFVDAAELGGNGEDGQKQCHPWRQQQWQEHPQEAPLEGANGAWHRVEAFDALEKMRSEAGRSRRCNQPLV